MKSNFFPCNINRREAGNCAICWYAAAITDISISGKSSKAFTSKDMCCGYGTNGSKTTGQWDCIIIPGIVKATKTNTHSLKAVRQCGRGQGIVTKNEGTTATVCCKFA